MPNGNCFHSHITSLVRDFRACRLAAMELVTHSSVGRRRLSTSWDSLTMGHNEVPWAKWFHQPCWQARYKNQGRNWLPAPKSTQSELVLLSALHISIFSAPILCTTIESKALWHLATGTNDPGLPKSSLVCKARKQPVLEKQRYRWTRRYASWDLGFYFKVKSEQTKSKVLNF